MISISTLLALISLLPGGAFSEATVYSPSRSFFHDLSIKRQQIILHSSNLSNEREVDAQTLLLSDETFNILENYNSGCELINEERANKLLDLADARGKLFEMKWLGPGCLTDTIVAVRGRRLQWPLLRFPILMDGFRLKGRSVNEINELLGITGGWHSTEWVEDVDWSVIAMDLSRLTTIGTLRHLSEGQKEKFVRYLMRHNSQITQPRELENFFTRSLLIVAYLIENLLERRPRRSEDPILGRFLRNLSIGIAPQEIFKNIEKSLGVFKQAKGYAMRDEVKILETLRPGPFEGPFVQAIISSASIKSSWLPFKQIWPDWVKVDLFTLAVRLGIAHSEKESIKGLLRDFFDHASLFYTAPARLRELVWELKQDDFYADIIREYAYSWINDDQFFPVLYDLVPTDFKQSKAVSLALKRSVKPLKSHFEEMRPHQIPQSPHIQRLYSKWMQDKYNWPGFVTMHEQVLKEIKHLFEHLFESETYDPKVDKKYAMEDWKLVFSCIIFEMQHAIPRSFVPSKCFLEALLHLEQREGKLNGFKWIELQRQFSSLCSFPIIPDEQDRYMMALNAAKEEMAWLLQLLSWTDGQALHFALVGSHSIDQQDDLATLCLVIFLLYSSFLLCC